ncbi:Mut7-C RNAse domain-containing protein [Bacteroidota bacterium]
MLKNNDRISVFPVFELFDISELIKLREKPLRNIKFICDVHLGKLCKYLRMLGFDTLYSNQYTNDDLTEISNDERRIILSKNSLFKKMKTYLTFIG